MVRSPFRVVRSPLRVVRSPFRVVRSCCCQVSSPRSNGEFQLGSVYLPKSSHFPSPKLPKNPVFSEIKWGINMSETHNTTGKVVVFHRQIGQQKKLVSMNRSLGQNISLVYLIHGIDCCLRQASFLKQTARKKPEPVRYYSSLARGRGYS